MRFLLVFPHRNALNPTSGDTTRSWNLVHSLIKNDFNVSILHSINSKGLEDKKLKETCKIYYVKNLNIFALREKFFDDINLTTDINKPFPGCYVPIKFLHQENRVKSIMIEINRELYMNEDTGGKNESFDEIKNIISTLISQIIAQFF